jgi:hypothetical protein
MTRLAALDFPVGNSAGREATLYSEGRAGIAQPSQAFLGPMAAPAARRCPGLAAPPDREAAQVEAVPWWFLVEDRDAAGLAAGVEAVAGVDEEEVVVEAVVDGSAARLVLDVAACNLCSDWRAWRCSARIGFASA